MKVVHSLYVNSNSLSTLTCYTHIDCDTYLSIDKYTKSNLLNSVETIIWRAAKENLKIRLRYNVSVEIALENLQTLLWINIDVGVC